MNNQETNEANHIEVSEVRPSMDSTKARCSPVPRLQNREVEYRPIYEEIGRAIWCYYRNRCLDSVAQAIRRGILKPPAKFACHYCGFPAEIYEHRNYAKPLDVEPSCDKCNKVMGPASLDVEQIIQAIDSQQKCLPSDSGLDPASMGRLGGKSKSPEKAKSSAANGKLGGRPKGSRPISPRPHAPSPPPAA